MTTRIKGYGLNDLIKGQIPTFEGWDTDPADGANTTDNDSTTTMSTGSKVLGAAWQYAYVDFDLGAPCYFLMTGYGHFDVTAGTGAIYGSVWNGDAWHGGDELVAHHTRYAWNGIASYGSKVRYGFTSSAACTLTPDIRLFNVWKIC